MEIKLNKSHKEIVKEVAKRHSVDADKLEGLYYELMERNFFDEVATIANENEEYLKGEA